MKADDFIRRSRWQPSTRPMETDLFLLRHGRHIRRDAGVLSLVFLVGLMTVTSYGQLIVPKEVPDGVRQEAERRGRTAEAPVRSLAQSAVTEGYFVIGFAAQDREDADRECLRANKAHGLKGHVVSSSDWANLTPGLHVVIYGSFSTMAEASALLAQVKPQVPDAYVKASGTRRLPADAPHESAPDTVGAEIRDFLERWTSTLCARKVEEHCACYAEHVDIYFTFKDVSKEKIRRDKVAGLKPFSTFQMETANLEIVSASGLEAVVEFDKSWEAHGAREFSGSERQRLRLRRTDGSWKIISEEELKVYWVKKSK